MRKIIKYILVDILRNKTILFYAVLLFGVTMGLMYMTDAGNKAILSILNVLLIVLPLICLIFSSAYMYNSSEFIEMLAAQPIKRRTLLGGIVAGLSISLCLALLFGLGIPLLLFNVSAVGWVLLICCLLLSLVFVALAVCTSIYVQERAKGIGISILWWFFFTAIYDAIVLLILFQFSDYPLEKTSVALTALNPVDITRIVVMLRTDVSAMMSYSGAVFQKFFSGDSGFIIGIGLLLVWISVPLFLSFRRFLKKDL